MEFKWDQIQYREDKKVFLLYRLERIFEEGLVVPGMKVLDVGGWGQLATRLMQEMTDVLILDKFTDDQCYAERVRSLPYLQGDVEDINSLVPTLTLNSFDLVTCFETLEHCKSAKSAVENIYALLKEGGTLVGTYPIAGVCHAADDPNVIFTTARKLKTLLTKAGFKDVVVEETASINKDDEVKTSYYFKGTK